MAQFREAAAREQEVIAEQRPIQEERARVKAQIEAYSARHKELTVRSCTVGSYVGGS